MKKIRSNIKFNLSLKLFLLIFTICICILIGLIINGMKKEKINFSKYVSDYINFNYDDTFEVSKEKDYIELTSKNKKTSIVIKKLDYTGNIKNKDKSEIVASLSYQVVEDEEKYKETYNGNEGDKYFYLYENYEKRRQIEVISIFDESYIYVIIYSANNDEFDLYKESVDIIVDSIHS